MELVMKVFSIVGAKPNYVKLAAVYDVFSRFFEHVVVDTRGARCYSGSTNAR
jgi:UDP-N-acetylglucosamine 2-epimerase